MGAGFENFLCYNNYKTKRQEKALDSVIVDKRVHDRHPEIEDFDVLSAWKNAISIVKRETSEKDFLVVVGVDTKSRLLELVAAEETSGALRIFHAMTPPSEKTLREVGMLR
ncbi:MAG: hypothetical protein FWG23_06160 [Eggerthellaceae bacterium]|nr:hypothetical protein [Eggerthellaceae bacterium]